MGFGSTVLYSGIGLVVFMLLTAYDTQKLSQLYSYYAGDSEAGRKGFHLRCVDPVPGLYQHLPVCGAFAGPEQPQQPQLNRNP